MHHGSKPQTDTRELLRSSCHFGAGEYLEIFCPNSEREPPKLQQAAGLEASKTLRVCIRIYLLYGY